MRDMNLSRLTSRIHVLVGPHGLSVHRRTGWWKPAYAQLADVPMARLDDLGDALDTALGHVACASAPISFVIDDALARLFFVEPPRNATRLADCRAAAQLRLMQLYDAQPADYAIAADWDDRAAFLACALPSDLLSRLEEAAQARRGTVLSIAPHFVASWNRWRHVLRRKAWFATATKHTLTLAAVSEGRVVALRSLALPAQAWQEDWLRVQVEREAFRLGMDVPGAIDICGHVPGHEAMFELEGLACRRLGPPGMPVNASGLAAEGLFA